MKRTASMNLEWERDEYGSYVAQLPPVPGYPGTWYATVDHFMGISVAGDWHLTISNRPNPTVFLYKDIPGIVFHAKTPEELMNIVEERLTPEMIADALQAKGYMPNDFATASRKATKRKANLNLDWQPCDTPGFDYMAELPAIPGYPYSAPDAADGGAFAYVGPRTSSKSSYAFMFDIPVSDISKCVLFNVSFHIPNGDTAEEMMNIVDNLTVENIADRMAADGFEPVDNTTASRKADKRTAHFDLDWKKYYNSHGAYYEAELPSVPGYTAPGYMTSTIVWGSVDDPNLWTFLISLAGIDDGRMPTLSTVQLNAKDFGIPDAETPEEMMQAVENLNMDDIIFVLQQEGCQPYEED